MNNHLIFLTNSEKKEITQKLEEQFGIKEIPGILVRWGNERIISFSGDISKEDINKIINSSPLEGFGLYLAKQEYGIRLSLEGTQLLKEQITKNIFELDEKQAEEWMKGHELNISTGKKGFLVMKYKDNFLGCGKASENKISNFIPKERRLKERTV
jgi:NOL1/NOP2/fmu family ribosome biogenesis protein